MRPSMTRMSCFATAGFEDLALVDAHAEVDAQLLDEPVDLGIDLVLGAVPVPSTSARFSAISAASRCWICW